MKTYILPNTEIAAALKIFQNGGVVAFPTDTVYGLGALAFDDAAVRRLYEAKARPLEKSIPVLVADVERLTDVAREIPPLAQILAAQFLPGGLTLILPKKKSLPLSVSADDTVAVRVPNHEQTRALLRAAGALAATSANLSGQPSPASAQEAYRQLRGRIPLILDGGSTRGGTPSTLVDCTGDALKILREGVIPTSEILEAIKKYG
ncbi:MAG: hypothetical protein Fur002_05740 [Anaerolineales bacterium]